ncbi:MAG: LysR family transcriptional regulator [Pedobacter sp.]|nr:LysR family transcriptional regulator [Pedobacter sp.]
MTTKNSGTLQIRARLLLGEEIAMGPGKAELLAAIAETGSISAAARKMGMSYRRAWLLVDTMNRCFKTPLVSSAAGGTQGGGASLTLLGEEVLALYQQLETEVETAAHKQATALKKLLAKL